MFSSHTIISICVLFLTFFARDIGWELVSFRLAVNFPGLSQLLLVKSCTRIRICNKENIMVLLVMKACAFEVDFLSKHVSLGWKVSLRFIKYVLENAYDPLKVLIKNCTIDLHDANYIVGRTRAAKHCKWGLLAADEVTEIHYCKLIYYCIFMFLRVDLLWNLLGSISYAESSDSSILMDLYLNTKF